MFSLIAFAMLAANAPQDEWRTWPANPKYEMFGYVDAQGVFRYKRFRLREVEPTGQPSYMTNGVVKGRPLIESPIQTNDPEGKLAQVVANADRKWHEKDGSQIGENVAGPCGPNQPCPKPNGPLRPNKPAPDGPIPTLERDLIILVGGLAFVAALISAFVFGMILIGAAAIRAGFRYLTAPRPDDPPAS